MKQFTPKHRVADYLAECNHHELPIVGKQASIAELVTALECYRHNRMLYVVDEYGRLEGAISLGRLVRQVHFVKEEPRIHSHYLLHQITNETAQDLMQRHPISTEMDESLGGLMERMIHANVKEVPVLNGEGKIIGDITLSGLLFCLFQDKLDHCGFESERNFGDEDEKNEAQ